MSSKPTRTKLRLGILPSRPALRSKGVTEEELEALLIAGSFTDDRTKGRGDQKTATQKTPASSEKNAQ